jgi:hypothetical protein
MATRPNDKELNDKINRVIATHRAQLDAVLRQYNIHFFVPGESS